MIPEASLWMFACVHIPNSMTLVAQHFVDISMTAALENVSSCMLEVALVLTQLSVASGYNSFMGNVSVQRKY